LTVLLVHGAFADSSGWAGVIGGGIGHNLPQEAPRAFVDAVIEAGELAT
jgi:hypothetical protein